MARVIDEHGKEWPTQKAYFDAQYERIFGDNGSHSKHVDSLCCGDPGDCQCDSAVQPVTEGERRAAANPRPPISDRDAYEVTDPKHPDWYSNAVDLWDLRDR